MLNDRENILNALRERPLKAYEVMKRANVTNGDVCQSLLLKMRDEGLVKFAYTKGDGSSDDPCDHRSTATSLSCLLSKRGLRRRRVCLRLSGAAGLVPMFPFLP